MKKLIVIAAAVSALALLACGPGEGFDAGDEDLDAGTHADAATAQCPTTGGACGNVTIDGECRSSNELFLYCDENDQLQCLNCKTAAGGPYTCGLFNATYGYDCLAPAGHSCDPNFPCATCGDGCLSTLTCNPSTNKCE
jgi:hypothetical protein